MPPAEYKDHSQNTISSIAKLLASKNIGCLLWGEHLLRTFACALPAPDFKFILEDSQLDAAYTLLLNHGYTVCRDRRNTGAQDGTPARNTDARRAPPPRPTFDRNGSEMYVCPLYNPPSYTNPQGHTHPYPSRHVHFGTDDPHYTPISLFPKKNFLFWTPRITPGQDSRTISRSAGSFFFADIIGPSPTSDRGGRFDGTLPHRVLIPAPLVFVEALIYLALGERPGDRGIWSKWLMYLREAFVEHGAGDAWDRTLLHTKLRPVWQCASDGEGSGDDEAVMEVYVELVRVLTASKGRRAVPRVGGGVGEEFAGVGGGYCSGSGVGGW
ncbi:hypothetical protein BJX99DRAFT_107509 [Aspergillus californicus]